MVVLNPAAGPLPVDGLLKCKYTLRKNPKSANPRGGFYGEFTFQLSEGFEIFKLKVRNLKRDTEQMSGLVLTEETIYFREYKTQIQASFTALSEENFDQCLHHRWNLISAGDVQGFTTRNETPQVGFKFEIFQYSTGSGVCARGGDIRRRATTDGRNQQNAAAVRRAFEETATGNVVLGDSTTRNRHVEIVHARRRVAGGSVIPNDNSTRREAQEADREVAGRGNNEIQASAEFQPLELRLQGNVFTVEVNVASLRRILSLPPP